MTESAPSLWPYTERDTVLAPESVGVLLNPPEVQLTDAEKQEVYEYGAQLFDGPPDGAGKTTNLRKVDIMTTLGDSHLLYLDYFSSEAGREDARALGLLTEDGPQAISRHLYSLAAQEDIGEKAIRQQSAHKSQSWYVTSLAGRLAQPAEADGQQPDSPTVRVNFAPEKLLQKLALLQDFRAFYRTQSAMLQAQEPSPSLEAKAAVLKIHWAKVNSMMATLYPNALSLAEQVLQSPATPKSQAWREQLFAVVPLIRQLYYDQEHEHAEVADDFLRRLDLVRNGAENTSPGNRSSVSNELKELADTIESGRADREQPVPFVLPPETVKELDGITWHAEDLSTFLESVLDDWGLLSKEHGDYDALKGRTGTATDGKWQVVITPKGDSLSVGGKKKVMLVPQSFARSLTETSPAGALPVSAHELTHVLQNEWDEMLAKQLPIAQVTGRRHLTTREFGGIYEEQRVQAMLGRGRPTNTTYLRALQAKEAGGNQTEVARAFLAAGGTDTETGRELAADRILRLYRSGNHNSQPLDYIAQDPLATSMSELPDQQVRALAVAGGSFSIVDLAELHRVGLIDLPAHVGYAPAEAVLQKYFSLYGDTHANQPAT